ncbi:nuclear transport factor 2 family protein [Amycolatopsis sp. cmx-11-51]|uniref:nuclear transport factor 2 family protein n=1 Tax=Amycolatopsis sp. cmx-11-51 TaxID=2785797 RepID=UPI0039E4B902
MENRSTPLDRASVLRAGGIGVAALLAGSLTGGTASAAPERAREHPNVTLVRRYYQAYGTGDLDALRRFFAADIRWTIPGHHPLAGVKTGPDEVIAFFEQLGRSGFRAEILYLAADGDWVVDLHRGWSTTPAGLDITWALAYRIRDRKIAEAVNFAGDQHAADQYFWRHYPLARIPDRLEQD